MNRDELEHLIRASGEITNQYEFVIVGSQSILGPIPYPEPEFKMSAEADISERTRLAARIRRWAKLLGNDTTSAITRPVK